MTHLSVCMRWSQTVTAGVLRTGLCLAALGGLGLALVAAPALAQTGTVEGRVTVASTGQPIANAQVTIIGTAIGTRTDQNGQFALLNVPTGSQQLRVAAIGYKLGLLQLNVQTGTITTQTLTLSRSVLRLDEVVVTGTAGEARKRAVGNSISQIDLTNVADPPASMDQLLQGRAAGVQVMQSNAASGAGAQIRLRGAVSVSQSNQPLIYIDGVRVRSEGYRRNRPPVGFTGRSGNVEASPLNDLNPDDIDRIEVIKGSAASTLYGTEAAAGVIQIFTKKGRTGTPRWTFQIDQGFSNVRPFGTDDNPFLNLKPGDNAVFATDPEATLGGGSCADPSPNQDCSWLQNGYRQKYAGSVGGGVGGFTYYVSGGYQDYEGVLPNDSEEKVSTRGNFTFDVFDNVRIDWNTSYSNTRVKNTAQGNNAHGLTLNVYRAERNYLQSSDPRGLRDLLNQEITTDINRLVTGVTVNYTPWPWFSNRYTIGYDLAQQENRNLRPFGFIRARQGILSDEQITYQTLTSDYVGNVNARLTGDLRTTFSFGGQSITTRQVRTTAYGEGFAGPGVPEVSDASLFIARENRLRLVTAGFFFQNVLDYKNRYFFTAGIRFDGNSAFGSNLGLEAYPKASLSYVISDEEFWPTDLGEMKLRAALGFAGRAPGAFDAIRTWNAIASAGQPAFRPANVGNPDVGPERTREIELGFDAGFVDGRVSAEFTWYQQRTSDALFNVRQVPSNGFLNSQAANVGVIRNQGIELSVNAEIINQPNWGVDVGTNIYTNQSKVLDLGGAVPFGAGGGWVEEGFPVMAARGDLITNPDAIADPVIETDHIFGPQQPTFVFTPSINIRLPKGVQLSARGEYQGGAWIQDGASFNALSRSVRWPTCNAAYTLIDAGNSDQLTARQRAECIPGNTNSRTFYFKQDFFKIRDVTLSIPMEWAIRQAQSASLTLTAQNYVRWINSDLRMFDPEMVARESLSDQNRSISEHIPPPAIFTASLRIGF